MTGGNSKAKPPITSKVKLISCLSTAIIVDIKLRFQSFYKCLIDCIHPKKGTMQWASRGENRGESGQSEIKFLLNFNYIHLQQWHRLSGWKKRAQKSQPQKVKHIELLSVNTKCAVYLCKSIICSFDCSMYQINAATHTRVSSLICNQKLMKITLQPHFSAI